MRLPLMLALALAASALAGCGSSASRSERIAEIPPASGSNASANASADAKAVGGGGAQPLAQDVAQRAAPDSPADASQTQPAPVERKIIRDATLTLEVAEPVKAAERVTSIAESRGGYVVSSESRHESGARGGKTYEVF